MHDGSVLVKQWTWMNIYLSKCNGTNSYDSHDKTICPRLYTMVYRELWSQFFRVKWREDMRNKMYVLRNETFYTLEFQQLSEGECLLRICKCIYIS